MGEAAERGYEGAELEPGMFTIATRAFVDRKTFVPRDFPSAVVEMVEKVDSSADGQRAHLVQWV